MKLTVILLLLLGGCFVIFKARAQKNQRKLLLADYSLLTHGVKGKEYEIAKLATSWKGEAQANGILSFQRVLYSPLQKSCYIVCSSTWHEHTGGTIMYKIDTNGFVVDSLSHARQVSNCGAIFLEDSCIDWLITGEREAKPYDRIIEAETLTSLAWEELCANAEIVEFFNDIYTSKGKYMLFKNKKWTVIQSNKLAEYVYDPVKQTSVESKRPWKFNDKFLPIVTLKNKRGIQLQREVSHESGFLLRYFDRQTKERSGFMDLNSTSMNGWHGMGYYTLTQGVDEFKLKMHTFLSNNQHYSLAVDQCKLNVQGTTYHNLVVFSLNKSHYVGHSIEEAGIYILRKIK